MTVHAAEAHVRDALAAYPMDPGLAVHRAAEARLVRGVAASGPVLDLGGDDGVFATLVWGRVRALRLVGCDVDATALSRADRYDRAVAARSPNLPFRDGAFGTVLCNSVLTHVVDLDHSLAAIRRVMRPDGLLVATVPTPRFHALLAPCRAASAVGLHAVAARLAARYDRAWAQHHFMDRAAWSARLEAAGLRLETWTEYLGGRDALVWSTLLIGARFGIGRYTVAAAARRLLPAQTRRAARVDAMLARAVADTMRATDAGGSALLVARGGA